MKSLSIYFNQLTDEQFDELSKVCNKVQTEIEDNNVLIPIPFLFIRKVSQMKTSLYLVTKNENGTGVVYNITHGSKWTSIFEINAFHNKDNCVAVTKCEFKCFLNKIGIKFEDLKIFKTADVVSALSSSSLSSSFK